MKLIIEDDEGRKTVVPFVREEITIGRQEGNTIRLTERNVSRKHARLLRQNGHVLVEDLGSSNGIRINGEKISGQKAVHSGDLIQIGDYDLAIQTEVVEPATAPVPVASRGDNEPTLEAPRAHPPDAPTLTSSAAEAETEVPSVDEEAEIEDEAPAASPPQSLLPDIPDEPAEAEAHAEALEDTAPPHRDEQGRRVSTSVIRMDELEAEREQRHQRQVTTLEPEVAPRLFVLNTDLQGREFACIRTELKLGRSDENDIALDHRSLSRTHCKILREANGEWRVVDLQSANGLTVNGEKYAQAVLRSGDVIELGHVKLKFLAPGEPFRFIPGSYDGDAKRRGWVVPVVLLAVLAVAGGVGFKFQDKLKAAFGSGSEHPVEPPPPPPVHEAAAPQPPAPATPQPQSATAASTDTPDKAPTASAEAPAVQMARVDEKVKAARAAMAARDFEKATDILDSAQGPDGTRPKEAEDLLVRAHAELAAKKNLAAAQKELAAGDFDQAATLLNQVQGSEAYAKEYEQLRGRLDAEKAQANTKSSRRNRGSDSQAERASAKVTPAKAAPPPTEDAQTYYEDGTVLFKKKQYKEAATLFGRCLEVDPRFARCHMMLGSTDAKLRDVESGAKHYRMFVKLAPDDPEAPRVRALLEQYDKSRNP